ncbi:lipase family protein [Nocardia sp. CA-128927]|uniref:lipase family protein n=1 Tax=Nocardia sp. CA-128927 TaxID=3239975 RepID=UPI003D983013
MSTIEMARPARESRTLRVIALAIITSAAILFGPVAGIGTGPATAERLTPQSDPFYQPPAGYESQAPGTVLRSREMRFLTAVTELPLKVQTWQLLYRTTDLFGNPESAVTTVLLPWGAAPDEHRPLLSYEAFYDSTNTACAPSYVLQQDNLLDGLAGGQTNVELMAITAGLSQGWAVSVPDYEGPHGHLGVAKEPGYMSLDGIRAAEQFAPLGLAGKDTSVGVWGYSSGGMAGGWTAEMQPTYAPELNVKGVALGGPTPDLRAILHVNGSLAASVIGIGISSLQTAYPNFGAVMDTYLTPEGKSKMETIRSRCLIPNVILDAFTDYQRYFTIPIPQLLELPDVKETFDAVTLGNNNPGMPMYIYQAALDEIVPPATTDTMVGKYCAGGTPVQYQRDHFTEHTMLAANGMAGALNWLKARLAPNSPAPIGCHTEDELSTFLNPDNDITQFQIYLNTAGAALGLPVGPPPAPK